jgi:tellurite resistance protein TerC
MTQALQAFQSITLLEISAFLIPFLVAIWVDLSTHKGKQDISMGNAAGWSLVWFLCASAFGGFVMWSRGPEAASLYASGYLLEKALAIDNLFAFFMIFASFGLTQTGNQHFQHKILYWGILGAIVFRIVFLGAGAFIVNASPYVLVVFALIVLATVVKMWQSEESDEEIDYTKHWSVRLVQKFSKVDPQIDSGHFLTKVGLTPLFLCLVCIEVCDVIFAFDSMPVIIAVVKDPYLMITSSLWAAAGLRSLYFLLIAAQNKFWALPKAIMMLLIMVSFKLMGNAFGYHMPNSVSMIIITLLIAGGVAYSMVVPNPEEAKN